MRAETNKTINSKNQNMTLHLPLTPEEEIAVNLLNENYKNSNQKTYLQLKEVAAFYIAFECFRNEILLKLAPSRVSAQQFRVFPIHCNQQDQSIESLSQM